MAKKKTIRSIPQERTPMREQDPQVRAKNFEEVACGYSLEDALRESERCLMCPDQPCIVRLPGGHQYPRLHPEDQRKEFPRRLRHPHRHQSAAVDLRPRVPAGEPVRRRVHRGRFARSGRDRAPGALRRRHRDQGGLGQHSLYRTEPLPRRHRRLGAGRHGLRGGHGQGRAATSPCTKPSTRRAAC